MGKKVDDIVDQWADAMANALGDLARGGYVILDREQRHHTKPVLSDFLQLTPFGRATYYTLLNVMRDQAPDDVRLAADGEEGYQHIHRLVQWIFANDYAPAGLDFYMLYGLVVWGGQVTAEEDAKAQMPDGWRTEYTKSPDDIRDDVQVAPHPLSLLPEADQPE